MAGEWTNEQKRKIFEAAAVITEMQKAYGKQINLKAMLKGWEMILAEKYNAEQICFALRKYMERYSDIPAPADIIRMLEPEEPQITYAEYKHAIEQHAKEGYPMFGYYGGIIDQYEGQQLRKRESYLLERDKVLALEDSSRIKDFVRLTGSDA